MARLQDDGKRDKKADSGTDSSDDAVAAAQQPTGAAARADIRWPPLLRPSFRRIARPPSTTEDDAGPDAIEAAASVPQTAARSPSPLARPTGRPPTRQSPPIRPCRSPQPSRRRRATRPGRLCRRPSQRRTMPTARRRIRRSPFPRSPRMPFRRSSRITGRRPSQRRATARPPSTSRPARNPPASRRSILRRSPNRLRRRTMTPNPCRKRLRPRRPPQPRRIPPHRMTAPPRRPQRWPQRRAAAAQKPDPKNAAPANKPVQTAADANTPSPPIKAAMLSTAPSVTTVPGKDAATGTDAVQTASNSDSKPAHVAAADATPQPDAPAPQAAPVPQPAPPPAPPQGMVTDNIVAAPRAPAPAAPRSPPRCISPPPTPIPRPTLSALAVSVAARSLSGAKQFDIRLDPPELGRVDVRLSIDASGKTQAHMTADQPQTLHLLQKDSRHPDPGACAMRAWMFRRAASISRCAARTARVATATTAPARAAAPISPPPSTIQAAQTPDRAFRQSARPQMPALDIHV